MATERRKYLADLHSMEANDINEAAIRTLDHLLKRCTLNLVMKLTGISRTTLYKWLDDSLPLDVMNHRDAAWFILVCETSPKVAMLMDRAPLSNPRLAGRLLETEGDTDE